MLVIEDGEVEVLGVVINAGSVTGGRIDEFGGVDSAEGRGDL